MNPDFPAPGKSVCSYMLRCVASGSITLLLVDSERYK